jgi:hypothetical protein
MSLGLGVALGRYDDRKSASCLFDLHKVDLL